MLLKIIIIRFQIIALLKIFSFDLLICNLNLMNNFFFFYELFRKHNLIVHGISMLQFKEFIKGIHNFSK